MKMYLNLTGDKALLRALKVLPYKIERKVIGRAADAAMRPMITAARRNALKGGRLRGGGKETRAAKKVRKAAKDDYRLGETIGKVVRTYSGTKLVVVGPMYTGFGLKGRVGHLVEEGHKIVPPKSGPWKRILKHRAGGRARAFPFMKPAWDSTVGQAKQVLVAKLRAGIEREAAAARGR